MGLCPPEQVDYNSACYQVYNMSGFVDITTNVDILDYAFFLYEQQLYQQNPAFIEFNINNLSGCSLELTALQVCNNTNSCSWSGLNAGNYTLTAEGDTVFNPTSPNTATACGCASTNNNYPATIWYIRLENLNSTTQNCTVDLQASSVDVCSQHGNFSSSNQASYCLCDDGYAGSQCQYALSSITPETTYFVNTNPNEVAFFTFEHENSGFYDITFNAMVTSGNCSGTVSRVSYTCGDCTPGYPYPYSTVLSSDFIQSGSNYSQYLSSSNETFSVNQFDGARESCGCTSNNTLETWFWAVDASQVDNSCSFEVSVSLTPACGSPSEAVCGGVGTCTANLCECPSGREGVDCEVVVGKTEEMYNGLVFAKKIRPKANIVTRTYVVISPLTNRQVKINLKSFSGSVGGYLGIIESEGQSNPTVHVNGTLDQNGTIIFLASFSHHPTYDLIMQPDYFPSMEVNLDVNQTTYDYAGTLKSDSGVSVIIPVDKNTPDKLYITVVSLGTYSVIDSKPLEETDIEFVVYVNIEDNYATIIDVVLMVVFILLVLFFCVAWKTCPLIFHATMRRIIPELYYMEYHKREEEQAERVKMSTEVAKTAAYVIAGTMYGLMQVLATLPYPHNMVLAHLPKKPTLEAVFDLMDDWMNQVQLPVVKVDVIPNNFPPRLLLQMIKANVPDLSIKMKIPSSLSPADLLNKISSNIPNVESIDINIPCTNFPAVINALVVKFPNVSVLKEIGIELAAIAPVNIPLVPMPPKMDVPTILTGFKMSLTHIPNIPNDIPLFVKIDKLLAMPEIQGLTLEGLGLSVVPLQIPMELKHIHFPKIHVHNFKLDISLTDVEVDIPKLGPVEVLTRFLFGLIIIGFQNAVFLVVEFLILMFNVAIIHSAFFEYATFKVYMPALAEIKAAFAKIVGDYLSNFIYVITGFFKYVNFFFLLDSWNCGGTLTMIAPFVFLIGALVTWIILEKDLLLYVAIKLKVHRLNPKSKMSAVVNSMWMGVSRVMVKVTILTLQAVMFCLTQAVTTTATKRTCNDVDLIANTFGKIIVAFFYVFFYVMFFFIFTGAPDWERYKGMKFLPSAGLLVLDGIYRFCLLTMGVWNDTTVRAFNIIGRSQRYDEDLSQNPVDSAMLRLGGAAPGAVSNILKQTEATSQMRQALHEQIMHLIAVSRTVVWIPVPLCVTIAKFSEALNSAIVFLHVKNEPVKLRRVLPLRIFIWIFHVVQMPLVMAVVFTASEKLTVLLVATLLPLVGLRTVVGLFKLIMHSFGSMKDIHTAHSVVEMADLA